MDLLLRSVFYRECIPDDRQPQNSQYHSDYFKGTWDEELDEKD